jgi:magnesium-transporting ATPase (P-type)
MKQPSHAFWSVPAAEALQELQTTPQGLNEEEAQNRLARHGANLLIRTHRQPDLSGYQKLDEVPYDFVRKRLSILVSKDGASQIVTKGALLSLPRGKSLLKREAHEAAFHR